MRTTPRSRSDSVREDEELRLPRAPGLFRRYWARHPVLADVLIALVCLLLSLAPAGRIARGTPEPVAFAMSLVLPALVIAACVTLLWRRRAPLLPFVAAFTLEMVLLFTALAGGTPLVLVACYSLAVYGSARAAWTGFGIGLGTLCLLSAGLTVTGGVSFQNGLNTVLSALVFGLIGTLIGVNVGGRKRYLAAIIDRSRQLLVERDQQSQLAAAAERARIAREMHDIVSHSLTVIVALSEGASATADRDQARRAASAAAETARSALTEMRAMLGVLRDDDSPAPLAPMTPTAPRETVAIAQEAGYPVSLTVSGSPEVPPAIAHAVGRIVQEGVTNAMRHAPAATGIAVRIEYAPHEVVIVVSNDGVTGPPRSGGYGLRGITERAAHVGGVVRSGPDGAGHWTLRAALPVATADPDDAAPTTSQNEEER